MYGYLTIDVVGDKKIVSLGEGIRKKIVGARALLFMCLGPK